MIFAFELAIVLLSVLALGIWGILTGLRQARKAKLESPVSPQQLSALAQPYRELMGEAVAIHQEILTQLSSANKVLKPDLHNLALRLVLLLKLAYPKAQHGTKLKAYLLKLSPQDAEHAAITTSAEETAQDLRDFVGQLKTLRGKLYQILSGASQMSSNLPLKEDLEETLSEVIALEKVFVDAKKEALEV